MRTGLGAKRGARQPLPRVSPITEDLDLWRACKLILELARQIKHPSYVVIAKKTK